MKQLDLLPKHSKPIPCNWLLLPQLEKCPKRACFMIHKTGYCSDHIAKAERMFGRGRSLQYLQ